MPDSYLCEIQNFNSEIVPVAVHRNSVDFFCEYIFGYPAVFNEQFEVIERILLKKDSIVLLPTGFGKSLIYQLSSFLVPGVIIVVSPLISLIDDQEENLRKYHGVSTSISFSHSVNNADRQRMDYNRMLMQHNGTNLIYIAPERLLIPAFHDDVDILKNHNNVFAVAIDEAHCISEWGHDFRPAYMNIGNISRQLFGGKTQPVLVALTGTASDHVVNDIRNVLGAYDKDSLIRPDTFDRRELKYMVKTCSPETKDYNIRDIIKNDLPDKFGISYDRLILLDDDNTYSGLIFTQLATTSGSNYSALYLHSSLSQLMPEMSIGEYFSKVPRNYDKSTWKATIQDYAEKYKNNKINMLVATKAFGMGIDKKNVKYVIHNGIPASFEEYYQEAGRAGRDHDESHPAYCTLLLSDNNKRINKELLSGQLNIQQFKEKYESYNNSILSKDDISSLLYFHNESFRGIKEETDSACSVLRILFDKGYEQHGKRMFKKQLKPEEEKEWLQAIVRLEILGIIESFTYDYRGSFVVICGSVNNDDVSEKYARYVAQDDVELFNAEKNKILEIQKSGYEFAKETISLLVEYIYSHIEASRRRAILNMYVTAEEASVLPPDEQDAYIRSHVISYFSFSGINREDLSAIEKARYGGLAKVASVFEISVSKENYSDAEKSRARELYILAGRLLESNPFHPGLLMAQAVGRVIAEDFDELLIRKNINASLYYAVENYNVDIQVLKNILYTIENLILNYSADMFNAILDDEHKLMGLAKSEMLAEMIKSNMISDANRVFVLAGYACVKLNNRGKANDN